MVQFNSKNKTWLLAELEKRGLPTDGPCNDTHITRLYRDDNNLPQLTYDRPVERSSYSTQKLHELISIANHWSRRGRGIRTDMDKDTLIADLVLDDWKLLNQAGSSVSQPTRTTTSTPTRLSASAPIIKTESSTSTTPQNAVLAAHITNLSSNRTPSPSAFRPTSSAEASSSTSPSSTGHSLNSNQQFVNDSAVAFPNLITTAMTGGSKVPSKRKAADLSGSPQQSMSPEPKKPRMSRAEFSVLQRGPTVTFLVGPDGPEQVEYGCISKALAVHCSPVLRAAFTGDYKEAQDRIIRFDEDGAAEFDLIVEWMSSNGTRMTVPETCEETADLISLWIGVAKIADRLDLFGDCDEFINDHIKKLLVADVAALESAHLQIALEMPQSHPTRKLLLSIVAFEYVGYDQSSSTPFRFQKELDDNSSDVLPALHRLVAGFEFPDPLETEKTLIKTPTKKKGPKGPRKAGIDRLIHEGTL